MIELIVYIAIIGLIVYVIPAVVPMPAPFKTIIYVVGAIVCLLILLRALPGLGVDLP
jgi:hypothetical protein